MLEDNQAYKRKRIDFFFQFGIMNQAQEENAGPSSG